MALVLDQVRLAVQMPDMDGDWDEYHRCQSSDSDSDFEPYPDSASNVDGDVKGVVLARSACGDGGGSVGFSGGRSME